MTEFESSPGSPKARDARRAATILWAILLCAPMVTSCAATSANMPLDAPAAFANGETRANPGGGHDVDLDLIYWKSAAPLFAFGFARTELSDRKATAADFRNMWDRDWTRLGVFEGSRPGAHLKLRDGKQGAYLNIYVIVWESTASNDLEEYRFFGSRATGTTIEKFKLERRN